MKQAENLCAQKESTRFYRLVNDISKEFRPHITACRDSNGLILNEIQAIMNRRKQYFQDLLGGPKMEANHMKKETAQESHEAEDMPN
jgi:hypothetical protein